jgi:hypothetical protein
MVVTTPPRTPERRSCPRYELDARISVNVNRSRGNASFWGLCTDIGEGGLGATIVGDLIVGEAVTVELPAPTPAQPVTIQAIVRYRNGYHCGFEFERVDDAQRAAIKRACDVGVDTK